MRQNLYLTNLNALALRICFLCAVLFCKTCYAEKIEWIHLNYNENPFGCSPLVSHAMIEAVKESSHYPDLAIDSFIYKLASYHSIEESQLLVENGLSAVMRTVAETFIEKGDSVMVADPSYRWMEIYAEGRDAKTIKVPLNKDFSYDFEKMLSLIDTTTKLIYIVNPHNPTGSITPRTKIEQFIKNLPQNVYVFIDEAYHHFAVKSLDYRSFIDHHLADDRIIVGRSFSKAYGLAGLRLGYGVSTPKTILKLRRKRATLENNIVAMKAGIAALNDETWLQACVNKHHELREEFYKEATSRGLKYIPTHANFIMLETNGKTVQSLLKHFSQNHILLGKEFPPLTNYVRISFGLPEQMKYFWSVWDKQF